MHVFVHVEYIFLYYKRNWGGWAETCFVLMWYHPCGITSPIVMNKFSSTPQKAIAQMRALSTSKSSLTGLISQKSLTVNLSIETSAVLEGKLGMGG